METKKSKRTNLTKISKITRDYIKHELYVFYPLILTEYN